MKGRILPFHSEGGYCLTCSGIAVSTGIVTGIGINAVSLSPSWYQKWTREPVMGLLGNTWIKQSFLKETALV